MLGAIRLMKKDLDNVARRVAVATGWGGNLSLESEVFNSATLTLLNAALTVNIFALMPLWIREYIISDTIVSSPHNTI